MMMLVVLGSVIGAALLVVAIAYARLSRRNQEPIELGVGGRLPLRVWQQAGRKRQ